ncbi:lysylphosphatidylglycerol synthase domain-containing protein [Pseudomonas jinjuensis]|uniref:Lysylphosphatidylglycerol synthase TM region n=1 Tax=Pseudomonas jinjuensis TaxID=198616 RepID=A0A1H0CY57_9PSED|nr:lysylphosphatidylglycerol synthase domain-containing protein [Pseudomonas jinjuensis]SDN62809.1 hypothetical protein SAMN05216193_10464 [Pseudomonas jinjuensis]
MSSIGETPGGHVVDERRARRWKLARRAFSWGFLLLLPVLLFLLARTIDWKEVLGALGEYKRTTLLLGLLVSIAGYTVFSSYDVLSRYYIGHPLPVKRVFPVAFVCNAFNLNLSSWVGGVALRYRLYSRLGMSVADITRILSFSMITNWFGFMLIGGALFALGLPDLPEGWKIGNTGLQAIGVLLLGVCAFYLWACRFAHRRTWGWRRYKVKLPTLRVALLQAGLGIANWSLMALLITVLLPDRAHYPEVLAILLISSIAGVIAHIPAGLGVLETVFITLLHSKFSKGTLLAALIGYRALYFLLPLLLACAVYLWLERRARRLKKSRRNRKVETP